MGGVSLGVHWDSWLGFFLVKQLGSKLGLHESTRVLPEGLSVFIGGRSKGGRDSRGSSFPDSEEFVPKQNASSKACENNGFVEFGGGRGPLPGQCSDFLVTCLSGLKSWIAWCLKQYLCYMTREGCSSCDSRHPEAQKL